MTRQIPAFAGMTGKKCVKDVTYFQSYVTQIELHWIKFVY